jgi:DNA-binding PadR family transcriptional regulator
MLSWKQKKLRDEKHRAKRKVKKYSISHAGKDYMGKILAGADNKNKPVTESRVAEKFRTVIRRSIFGR